ncbi:integrase-type DNA-binding superfamily protein [Actinidia rufa]|uniref:Integrase-type DNA-binding superfamily protein n=1 Tax=Actinidia rufa TaxID=165716 RepID=A0A7J0GZK6_9ERIC|nr:integrase-type DNA-binding superfamily protein [Actinidia rufa]
MHKEVRTRKQLQLTLVNPVVTILTRVNPIGPDPTRKRARPRAQKSPKRVQRKQQAPGFSGGPNEELGKVGIRDPGAEKEVADMAGDFSDAGDGGSSARRRRTQHQGQRRRPQFPLPSCLPPRPASLSPATSRRPPPRPPPFPTFESAAVDELDSVAEPGSSSSSSSSLVLAMELASSAEELGEIVELPSLGASYDSAELGSEFVYGDSVDGWLYPPPWFHCGDEQVWGRRIV